MPKRTQAHRPVRIGTPLGDDVLLIKSLKGVERLGQPFEYELVLLSEQHDLNYKDIIGQNVTVAVEKKDKEPRYFNGYVSRFSQTRFESDLVEYRAVIVPWLWFLSRSSDCRIFQNLTLPEIIQQVFKDHGFTDVSDRLHGTYPKWEYCVQYRETAFHFVSRLMEQEGIYYYFKHENGKHTLVLCDTIGSHLQFVGYEELLYYPRTNKAAQTKEYLWSWIVQHEVQSGGYSVNDFDFQSPKKKLLSQTSIDRGHAAAGFELYDYPGQFTVAGEGERYSRVRIEERQAQHETFRGEGDARGICTGVRFTLKGHPRKDLAKEYLTIGAEYRIESDDFETVEAASKKFTYEATVFAIDSATPFRAARTTAKPTVQGPQTAIVVGPKGEEIHTDKFGRVKVHFHWDRYDKADENSSCWVRVAQVWAGKKWGAIYIPRVGQEVIVDFLEGDPDRPIITGRVYNNDAMPPYDLPAHKTKSTLKSLSSKGGGGFNEIRFEDKKGEEQIFLHAEKDQDIRVKNDRKEWIGNERHAIVKKDQTETIEGNDHTTVKGNQLAKIDGDQGQKVLGNRLASVEKNDHLTTQGDQCVKVNGDINLKGAKNLNQEAGTKISIKAGSDLHLKAGANYAVEAGANVHIKGGAVVVIEGGAQLSIKAGPSFIDLGPAGVSISGPMVKINSGGAAGSGSGSSPTAPAAPEAPDPPKASLEAVKADPGQVDEAPPAPAPPTPVTYSSAAQVLQAAAEDGAPFCEECARAAEEEVETEDLPMISSIQWLDGDGVEAGDVTQWVNLPKDDKWVDKPRGVTSKDRLGRKARFKVAFDKPGAHSFKVKAMPGDENSVYSGGEKGRNANFKWTLETAKQFTTDGDGTKVIETEFEATCAGLDTFRLAAEDTNNNPEVETGTLTTKRVAYVVPVKMAGMTSAADLGSVRSEFAKHGVDLVELPAVEIERMANIGPDEGEAYKTKLKAGFDRSEGKGKSPYAIGVGFTEHLAVKNPDQTLEITGVAVGPGKASVDIPVMVRGKVAGSGLQTRKLWKDLVPGQGWFVSATYTPDSGGEPQTIPEAKCASSPAEAVSSAKVRVDVTGLPEGTGTIKVTVNVVDRMRGGLSFKGGNLVCICTKGWWKDVSAGLQGVIAIHEIGHKVGMVANGTGKLPDQVESLYEAKGHLGPHCHYDLPEQETYSGARDAKCVMFGSSGEDSPSAFCELCAPTVRKLDLSEGWTA